MAIEYTQSQIIEMVNNNIITMHNKRGYQNVNITNTENNNIFLLSGDVEKRIYFTPKLLNISNNTSLDTFLSDPNTHKIIISKGFSKKVLNRIYNNYKNVEYFFEYELIEDITEKIFNPKFELLNEESKNKLIKAVPDNELAKIQSTDVMCRYYGGKVDDIFKIIRPSITSGYGVFYRKVINGSINILF